MGMLKHGEFTHPVGQLSFRSIDWPRRYLRNRHGLGNVSRHLNDGIHRPFRIRGNLILIINEMNAVLAKIAIVNDLRLAQ